MLESLSQLVEKLAFEPRSPGSENVQILGVDQYQLCLLILVLNI
jgi:hypothetical protein